MATEIILEKKSHANKISFPYIFAVQNFFCSCTFLCAKFLNCYQKFLRKFLLIFCNSGENFLQKFAKFYCNFTVEFLCKSLHFFALAINTAAYARRYFSGAVAQLDRASVS